MVDDTGSTQEVEAEKGLIGLRIKIGQRCFPAPSSVQASVVRF